MKLLLNGEQLKAKDAIGWLCDFSSTQEEALEMAWKIANEEDHGVALRTVNEEALTGIPSDVLLPAPDNAGMEAARKAIMENIQDSCSVSLSEALSIQSRHSARFMTSKHCKMGMIGAAYNQIMNV